MKSAPLLLLTFCLSTMTASAQEEAARPLRPYISAAGGASGYRFLESETKWQLPAGTLGGGMLLRMMPWLETDAGLALSYYSMTQDVECYFDVAPIDWFCPKNQQDELLWLDIPLRIRGIINPGTGKNWKLVAGGGAAFRMMMWHRNTYRFDNNPHTSIAGTTTTISDVFSHNIAAYASLGVQWTGESGRTWRIEPGYIRHLNTFVEPRFRSVFPTRSQMLLGVTFIPSENKGK